MNSRNVAILDQIRAEALQRSIPAPDVERWMTLARPCARLTEDGDGPVVGRFGGPVMLPAGTRNPQFPLIATIDCAALPADVTDLPLPSDGWLLFFGFPEQEDSYSMGDVVYVPAGVAVEEWTEPNFYSDNEDSAEVIGELPRGEARLTADVSLPFVGEIGLPGPPWLAPMPGHPRSKELAEVWQDQWGESPPLAIGGYGTDFNGDDVRAKAAYFAAAEDGNRSGTTSPDPADWVLLAECNTAGRGAGAAIFWTIQRDDLIARRFDRVYVAVDCNP
ncbi:DUF1963 domain-containing protein [Actinoplanes sp. CA-252034]|uniref:DUF1963 domain-containing protein n=1 Tax=Actinoplanes sp. CA-252034 TaxID=3239906 RepID=UPI003D970C17